MKLNMVDLNPKDAEFSLSSFPKKVFTLKRFSLAVQIWANQTFGEAGVKEMFEKIDLERLSHLAFYLLKEKDAFKDLEDFRDNIINSADRRQMLLAITSSVNASLPVQEKPSGEAQSPSPLTGAQVTTS